MRSRALIIIILTLTVFPLKGQDNSVISPSAQNIYFSFRNINFIRNNEYSNPVTEGYTLIGYFLHPEIIYLPSEKISLKIGAHLLSYSGTNRYSLIKPLFSTTYYFARNSFITIGSLAGSETHRMSDPHFSRERLYNSYSEDGFQLKHLGEHFFSDTWLSWENFIFKGDAEREIFTAGESFRFTSSPISGFLRIEIPVQLQLKHYGGQISNYPEKVETYLNASTGVRLAILPASEKSGTSGLEYLYFRGSSLTKNAPSGIESGNGNWLKIFYGFKSSEIEAGFWTSRDFFAPNGNYIFGSVSDHLENVTVHSRKIITGSLSFTLRPESFIELYIGFDGYYDIDLKRFDNALTLHMRFDKLFRLMSLKRP